MPNRHKFTDKSLRALKAPTDRPQVDHWDSLLPGFGIRVGAAGKMSFCVVTRIAGKVTRFTLKPAFPLLSLADARAQAAKILADASQGLTPAAYKAEAARAEAELEANTFAGLCASYLASPKVQRERQIDEKRRKVESYLLPAWGARPASEITRADVKAILRQRAVDGGPIAANRLQALISAIFRWAVREEILTSSPALEIEPIGEEKERERVLTDAEIRALWEAFDTLDARHAAALKLMLITGQRRSEVGGLRWDEIDGSSWTLPAERTKTGKATRVPLSTLALETLDELEHDGPFAFGIYGAAPLHGSWAAIKRRIDARCTVKDWRLHDLRRTMATGLRSIGVDRLIVSKILNHAEAGVTKVYDRHAADPEKMAALERWANRLREIVSGEPASNIINMQSRA